MCVCSLVVTHCVNANREMLRFIDPDIWEKWCGSGADGVGCEDGTTSDEEVIPTPILRPQKETGKQYQQQKKKEINKRRAKGEPPPPCRGTQDAGVVLPPWPVAHHGQWWATEGSGLDELFPSTVPPSHPPQQAPWDVVCCPSLLCDECPCLEDWDGTVGPCNPWGYIPHPWCKHQRGRTVVDFDSWDPRYLVVWEQIDGTDM